MKQTKNTVFGDGVASITVENIYNLQLGQLGLEQYTTLVARKLLILSPVVVWDEMQIEGKALGLSTGL